LGITWAIIQVKAKHFGKELNDRGLMTDEEYESFKFSRCWIEGLRKRNDLKCIKLVGEANTLSEEAYQEVIAESRDSLHDLMETHNVPASHVFNANQTGLYYRRFPCTTICQASRVQHVKGTKAMKDKDRITAMVCILSDGVNVLLAGLENQRIQDASLTEMFKTTLQMTKHNSTRESQSGGSAMYLTLSSKTITGEVKRMMMRRIAL
jgi:hypothetical protein